ncbi:hypothetical protein D9Q98_002467 [Chlorella vulgaris]|uniref:Uncharacterized protein n=1 Tax=Chlorella vulgaris TaxID=3077 RepID=A0A9D4TT86_CHLVU|nr:hypothetical protein D9Q98_002467 [Chlorella vulgaris]
MASCCHEEDRGNPHSAIGGTELAAADTTAECANGKLALAVLATPGPPQQTILSHLEQDDKMRLASVCTSLRQASLAWFAEVNVKVVPNKTDVASLAAWLERHQARLHLQTDRDDATKDDHEDSGAERNDSLTALPSSLVTSLTTYNPLPAAVSAFTALTILESEYNADDESDNLGFSLSAHHLRPPTRLRQLSLVDRDMSCAAEELLSLPALAGLQALGLRGCKLKQLPRALSAVTQLTALNVSRNGILDAVQLASLHRLQRLDLRSCQLTAVPDQLSTLADLTRLDLYGNSGLQAGWQHLQPLLQLQHLNLSWCSLPAVPEQLSALIALTCLDLSGNRHLAAGWQHLQPLPQLQRLSLWEEDRGNPHAAVGGVTGELALAALAPAGSSQLTILGHLEQDDKMKFGSACTSLRQASLAWFPEVTVEVQLSKIDVALLAAWLERHQARLHLQTDPGDAFKPLASQAEDFTGKSGAVFVVEGFRCPHISRAVSTLAEAGYE